MKSNAKILLTGASGMVGSNILNHSLSAQYCFLTPSSKELDLRSHESVRFYFDQHRPDTVIHAAGLVGGIQANIARPVDFLVENIDMARNVIMISQQFGVKNFINLASSCMYPRNSPIPMQEDSILRGELEPTNEGYALAKIFSTRLCQYIQRQNPDFLYKTLIPCNLYGPYDKFNPDNSHLIPAIIHKVHQAKVNNLEVVEVWGDGKARREFMYCGDLAEFIMRAVDQLNLLPELINVGLGFDYSIEEYYQKVADVIGWRGSLKFDVSKPVGMARKLICTKKIESMGWRAPTTLDLGIKNTYQYYLESMK